MAVQMRASKKFSEQTDKTRDRPGWLWRSAQQPAAPSSTPASPHVRATTEPAADSGRAHPPAWGAPKVKARHVKRHAFFNRSGPGR